MTKVFISLISACLITGCISVPMNPPLKEVGEKEAYSFNNLLAQGNEIGDNFVVVALSGGGTRAGSLSYGVLKALEEVKLPEGQSLLDEVKVISSVSGSSFVSAYYGLYGKEKFFRDYKEEVLYQKLSSQLLRNLIRFVHWVPVAFSADLGRSEVAQRLYDKKLFHGHTFREMPRRWPFVIINASDMTKGTVLSFIQEDFDRLCSDLNGIKLSRAVVASSAFPGPFTPIALKNYPKSQCGYELPSWVEEALARHPEEDLERFVWAQNMKAYEDAEARPFIHLFDGGVADNLGVNPLLFNFRMGAWNLADSERRFKAKRVILIIVDAKPADDLSHDRKERIPRLMTVLTNAASKPLRNYTVKSVQEFALRFQANEAGGKNFAVIKSLCDRVYAENGEREKCYDQYESPLGGVLKPPYPDLYLIHVQFDAIRNPELREKLGQIATDLQLKKDEVDLVIEAAGTILGESPAFQRLMTDLGAKRTK